MVLGFFKTLALLVSIQSALAAVAPIPAEISKVTGLNNAQIMQLAGLGDIGKRQSNCSLESTAGGIIKGPSLPTASEILKRNSFVKR